MNERGIREQGERVTIDPKEVEKVIRAWNVERVRSQGP